MCTPEVKIVQAAVKAAAAGKGEEYMAVVDDNLEYDVLFGILDAETARGKGKENFQKCVAAQGEHFDVLKFHGHSYTGFGPNVAFVVDWSLRMKKGGNIGKVVNLRAVVHKVVKNGKICEKYHCLDQDACNLAMGRDLATDRGQTPAVKQIQTALDDMYLNGKPETYMGMLHPDFDYSVLGGLIPEPSGSSADAFKQMGAVMGKTLETVRFEAHSWTGSGPHVMFCVDWEMKLNEEKGATFTCQAVVHKVVKDGKLCGKYHFICQYLAQIYAAKVKELAAK